MVDSYTVYAFSGSSASSITTQWLGAMLPFAAVPMYTTLGYRGLVVSWDYLL
ncbi:hypothetical protein DL98DRAFT_429620 [Cadophora sp. DSE1049]|nr:hypothetical protein DL98DRAFT_429620 [Cadophora sp. DSE1049]